MDFSQLPAVNASLNAIATCLLIVGRRRIRAGRIDAHRRSMLLAFAVSSLFLVLYVAHKAWRGFENTPYPGEGLDRALYLGILFSHVTLAITVPFLAVTLIVLGLRGRIARHRPIRTSSSSRESSRDSIRNRTSRGEGLKPNSAWMDVAGSEPGGSSGRLRRGISRLSPTPKR